jgi:hypothetical protein
MPLWPRRANCRRSSQTQPCDRGLTQLIYNQQYRLAEAYRLRMKEALDSLPPLAGPGDF